MNGGRLGNMNELTFFAEKCILKLPAFYGAAFEDLETRVFLPYFLKKATVAIEEKNLSGVQSLFWGKILYRV